MQAEDLHWAGPEVLVSHLRREGARARWRLGDDSLLSLLVEAQAEDAHEATAEMDVLFLRRRSAIPLSRSLESLGVKQGLGSGPQAPCREVNQPHGHGLCCGQG